MNLTIRTDTQAEAAALWEQSRERRLYASPAQTWEQTRTHQPEVANHFVKLARATQLRDAADAMHEAEKNLRFSNGDWTPETEAPYREAQRTYDALYSTCYA